MHSLQTNEGLTDGAQLKLTPPLEKVKIGATTFSITTLSITTFSITKLRI
jgi:hypothetical protein